MKALLVAIAVRILLACYPGATKAQLPDADTARARAAADDLLAAADLEDADALRSKDTLFLVTDDLTVRSIFVWSFFESSWRASPKGSNDKGLACGVAQIHVGSLPSGWLPPEWTCAAIRKDRVLGYRAVLRVLLHLIEKCGGDIRAGLAAYSTTGACPAPGAQTIKVVADRCKFAGC